MGKRKVSILEPAATAVAEVAFFIESKGLPETAKKLIDEVFVFLKNYQKIFWFTRNVNIRDGEASSIGV